MKTGITFSALIVVCHSVLFADVATAGLTVANQTGQTMNVKIFQGTTQVVNSNVQSGNTLAYAGQVPSGGVRVDVETLGISTDDWFGSLFAFNNNAVNIVEFNPRFGPTHDFVLDVYTQPSNGALIGRSTPDAGLWRPEDRDVQFYASADPQYLNAYLDMDNRNISGYQTNDWLCILMESNPKVRGILIAGDLTQTAVFDESYQWYRDSYHYQNDYKVDRLHYAYDGFGNHDYQSTGVINIQMLQESQNRKRSTVLTSAPTAVTPFYSWDWHDVHFANCNLAPANGNLPGAFISYEQLSYLQADLAANVGSSGRPVIIMHHYGFDSFSKGTPPSPGCPACAALDGNGVCDGDGEWWTEAQRVAYWNVIKNYNVVAILNGHLHLRASFLDQSTGHTVPEPCIQQSFSRPSGATGGPDTIPAFIVGCTFLQHWCSVRMGPNNEFVLESRNHDSPDPQTTYHLLVGAGVFAAPPRNADDFGDGSNIYPWRSIQNAVNAMDTISASVRPYSNLDTDSPPTHPVVSCLTGNYPGPARLDKRCRIETRGGQIQVGTP